MTVQRAWKTGVFSAHFEPPDVLISRYTGHAGLTEMQACVSVYAELAASGPFYSVINTGGHSLGAAERDYLSRHVRPEWFLSVVYVGADTVQRMALKALSMLLYFRGATAADFHFAATEQEARALVEHLRAAAKAPASRSS